MKFYQDELTNLFRTIQQSFRESSNSTELREKGSALQAMVCSAHQNTYSRIWLSGFAQNQFVTLEQFVKFKDLLNDYASLVSDTILEELKKLTFMRLNGMVYILNSDALNLIFSGHETNFEETSLPVYSFYKKELFDALPPLKLYAEDHATLYQKSFLPQLWGIAQRSRKHNITNSKLYPNISRHAILSSFIWDNDFTSSGKVIQLKSLCSGSAFDYSITNYTESKFRTKQCLAPVLSTVDIYSLNNENFIKANFYTFVFNSEIKRLSKYTKARRYFKQVLNSLMNYEGAYFYDKDKYEELRYASSFKRFIPQDSQEFFDFIQDFNIIQTKNSPEFLDCSNLLKITAKHNYPKSITSQLQNLTVKKEKAKKEFFTLTSDIHISDDCLLKFKDGLREIFNAKKHLERLEQECLAKQDEFIILKNKIPQIITNFKANIRKSRAYDLAQFSLSKDCLDYRLNNSKFENESLKNILKDLDIVEICFKEKSTNIDHSLTNIEQPDYYLELLSSESFATKFKLVSINYFTKRPQPISIDGSKTNLKIGGPYEVFISMGSVKVRPASVNSYYVTRGSSTSQLILTHPHSGGSTLSSTSTYFGWESCCLGDVSSILFKAWEECNFVKLFVAMNLWLTSANSTDMWGRRYNQFENLSDYQAYEQYISKKEINKSTLLEEVSDLKKEDQPFPTIEIVQPQNTNDALINVSIVEEQVLNNTESALENIASEYTPYIPLTTTQTEPVQ